MLSQLKSETRAWRDYLILCKPRVVLTMLVTVVVGMYLAPGQVTVTLLLATLCGIALVASAAAAINHIVDRRIDALMARTQQRPVAQGRIMVRHAIGFSILIGVLGLSLLLMWVNVLTAWLTFLTLIGYAGIYTGYLKRATPQNIVIGGLAGAAPPLLGWTSVTNHLDPHALLLVLIIFTWTPPHFWALAIYRFKDYQHADVPMLPVTHGIRYTKLNVLMYTILLLLASALPCVVGMSGWVYGAGAFVLGMRFLYWATMLLYRETPRIAMQTFRFSIMYLLLLFVLLLLDHYWVNLF